MVLIILQGWPWGGRGDEIDVAHGISNPHNFAASKPWANKRVQDTNGGCGCEESILAPSYSNPGLDITLADLNTMKNSSCYTPAVLRAERKKKKKKIVRKTGKSSQHSRELTLNGIMRTEKFPFKIWFKCTKPWVPTSTWHKLGMVTHASNPSTQEVLTGDSVQGHPQIHIKLGPNETLSQKIYIL